MKKVAILCVFLLTLCLAYTLQAQDFAGSYQARTANGVLDLTLRTGGSGNYLGSLVAGENRFAIEGRIQDGVLMGIVGDELDGIVFQARLEGNRLTFVMMESDDYGNPIPASGQRFVLVKGEAEPPTLQDSKQEETGKIIINGIALSPAQVAEIKKTYGVEPRAGNYWYDARSGLYGVKGYAAFGFMLAGHDFGKLEENASSGNTGIFVNGRQLPLNEYTVWSYIVGNWIQPGRYWLDDKGNAGYEGSAVPLINLYVAARNNAYRGKGAAGDNFWSTRFSAGNYDSGNTRGYVSVPGYGPVGYGF